MAALAAASRGGLAGARRSHPTPTCAPPRALPRVDLIATDVDGTLMGSDHRLPPAHAAAIAAASAAGVPVVVATGKSRGPWAEDLLPALGLGTPGVFSQGCAVHEASGEVRWLVSLDTEMVREVCEFVSERGIALAAYCGPRMRCLGAPCALTGRLADFGEEAPWEAGAEELCSLAPQKLLLVFESDEALAEVRPALEATLAGRATTTTAVMGMLEVLPLGSSKGSALERLLGEMGVDPGHVMAIGDGENDVEMLRLCGVAVAMGNAKELLKREADAVVASNDDGGFAEAVERFVLAPRAAAA